MYGILGEEDSDAQSLKVLVRGLANQANMSILARGFSGCGDLLNKGSRQLRAFADQGCDRFVVCHDADGADPSEKHNEIMQRVIAPSRIATSYCVVIPVQELEAWILADIEAVSNVFPSWRPAPIRENPEAIRNPKERLQRASQRHNKKPIYDPTTHNQRVAKYLRLDHVRRRCPSFERLSYFVTGIHMTPGRHSL